MRARRRQFLATALGAGALAAGQARAQAPAFPSRPLRLIVGFAAGGPADGIGRSMAKALEDELRQPVVVDNRAGAAGLVGLQAVTGATPDGYTIGLLANTTTTSLHFAGRKLDIDATLAPIGRFVSTRILLVVNPTLIPARTLPEFVEHLRRNPGTLMTSAGHGGLGHLGLALFALEQNLRIEHVAYKGSAPAMTDVIAGQVGGMVVDATSALPFIQTGKLRPICVASSSRVPSLPDLPTAIELGLTSLQIDSSMGLVAPPRTPQPIVDRLAEALRRAVDGASYTDAAARAGNERYFHDAAAFRQWLAGDFERWGNVIRQANIKVS